MDVKTTGFKQVIDQFCDPSTEDSKLYSSKIWLECTELIGEGEARLKGKSFVGLNVKPNSDEKSYFIYYCNPVEIKCPITAEDVEAMFSSEKLNSLEYNFRWSPKKGANAEDLIPEEFGGNILEDEGMSRQKGSEAMQKVLGGIYSALGLKDECFVYIWLLDFDLNKHGKPLSCALSICELEEDIGRVKAKRYELMSYILLVKERYIRSLGSQKRVESVKSAVAAIMSRNMSHNLGSHYLYYTKSQLASLAEELKGEPQKLGPEIRGASRTMGYMQARMDYLATIVAGDKYPYGSVFFKGQIFDELTIDDFSMRHFEDAPNDPSRKYKRTTNYLLQNLILSENYTRMPVVDDCPNHLKDGKNKLFRLQVITKDGIFTGVPSQTESKEAETIKLALSKLCVALPGGIMSIHAFYNVVENLVRNSAKYRKGDLKDELVLSIAITEKQKEWDKESNSTIPDRYEFVLFDNKANANKTYSTNGTNSEVANKTEYHSSKTILQHMTEELGKLKILNENNELNKDNKGLKEMLFSTLWMRMYSYNMDENKPRKMSEILAEIDMQSGEKKLNEIRRHAFEYVAVDDKGIETRGENANLGIRFELPKYKMLDNASSDDLDNNLIGMGLNNFSDILCVDPNYSNFDNLKKIFTRLYKGKVCDENDEQKAVEVLRSILEERFKRFDKYRLCMDNKAEQGFDKCEKDKFGIYFETHLSEKEDMAKYAYSEAISGENFTKTMLNIFNNGIINNEYVDSDAEYFSLKIKEAALTRITLIDERFYNDMKAHEDRAEFLKYKNVRVLSMKENGSWRRNIAQHAPEAFDKVKNILVIKDLFDGNEFRDGGNATHFLSIHLGMIEKIVKDDSPWVKALKMESNNLEERVDKFMDGLRDTFKTRDGEVFISIHSGRGNFSPDLDRSLKHYPFISVSALESVYSNSKYLLAQLFYNTVYTGKGASNG